MGPDERSKQAVAMLATGIFLADSGSGGGMNLNMGAALNSVLASQINALTGNMKNASLSFGVMIRMPVVSGRIIVSVTHSASLMTVSRLCWEVKFLPEPMLPMM